jgi:hypothetical protein
MQTLQIAVGTLLIIFTFLDFFHTTLSGNGFGWLSGKINRGLNEIILQNRSKSIFRFSGLIHLLVTTFVWLFLLFLGTFIIFTSSQDMVVESSTYVPATYVERFYFTCYLLSTLGIGDFIPGNDTSEVFAGILSFSGFILITTGLTYLLSVVNAVLNKKELSLSIATLGKDVEEMYEFFKKEDNLDSLMSNSSDMRQQILKNSSSYLAFPMVNFFLTRDREFSVIVQLARLYEVLMVLRMDWPEHTVQNTKICSIVKAIEYYLELGLEEPMKARECEDELNTLRSFWREKGHIYKSYNERDRQLAASLQYAGWEWEDVYKYPDQD